MVNNMNPIDTHLIKDTRKRTAKRNEPKDFYKLTIWFVTVLTLTFVTYQVVVAVEVASLIK